MNRPWLAHYDPWTPTRLAYPEYRLTDLLDAAADEVPDAPALAFLGATLSFRQVRERVDRFASGLERLGVDRGDRVGIMLPTCPQYVIATFAALRLGAIVVNINPGYTPRELLAIATDSGLRAIVTLDANRGLVQAVQAQSAIEIVIVTALGEYAANPGVAPVVEGALAFSALCAGATPTPNIRRPVDPDDVAVIQYTGGTTGQPKGAMLTHRNIVANVLQTEAFTERTHRRGEGRFLVVIPLFHIFGFTVGMMKATWMGALQILVPKFDPKGVLEAVRDFRPTYFPAVPTIWTSLVSHPEAAASGLGQIGICTSGAAPLPREVIERFHALTGRHLFEGFGLTEASPVTHSTPQTGARRPGTVGLPLPDTDIAIVDVESGVRPLAWGEPGELCVSGPQVMKGYWRRPDETGAVLRTHADGRVWLHTGDIACVDSDGYTQILQRKKDVVIVDGLSVYPSEVEMVLRQHAAVREAAAIGVLHHYHGEVIRAMVVLHEPGCVPVDELMEHCRRHLASYKLPVTIDLRETLPTSAAGKILYRVLREEFGRSNPST